MRCCLQLVRSDRVLPLQARANEAAGAGHADGGRRGGLGRGGRGLGGGALQHLRVVDGRGRDGHRL